MKGKVIIEEAFNLPDIAEAESKLYASPKAAVLLGKAMSDIQGRIKQMDEAGVEMQVLSFTSPGAQGVTNKDEAEKLAARSNDWIAKEVAKNPSRFASFAAVSMHDPAQAAKEATRAITELGLCGVMLNDFQSSGQDGNTMIYFDDAKYDVFWKTLEALDRPVYMHPRMATPMIWKQLYGEKGERKHLEASSWGFASQLSHHILAIATSGVFDRFPKLQLVFGHMGEHIPFDLWRLDHKLDRDRFPNMRMAKDKTIRDYFATNMMITTSGHFSTRSLQGAIAEIGASRCMFSIDYPYEDGLLEGASWFDQLPLAQPDMLSIGRETAIKLLKLDQAPHNMKLDQSLKQLEIGGLNGPIWPAEAGIHRTKTRGGVE